MKAINYQGENWQFCIEHAPKWADQLAIFTDEDLLAQANAHDEMLTKLWNTPYSQVIAMAPVAVMKIYKNATELPYTME